jgi:hypothetical protein
VVLQRLRHLRVGIGRQHGVGMQEQQRVSPAAPGTGVHLGGPATRRHPHSVGQWRGPRGGVVAAATVDHHQFHATRTQGLQCL